MAHDRDDDHHEHGEHGSHRHGTPRKPVTVGRVGGNDRCACGSGQKHSRCCANKTSGAA